MKTLLIALKAFIFFTILTGILYPLLVTAIAQLIFPDKANGSLIVKENRVVGSELIGQKFDQNGYFSSRPSAIDYQPLPSGGTNLAPTSARLKQRVDSLKQAFQTINHLDSLCIIPSEMIFSSASGLDPHISPQAAFLQVARIQNARAFDDQKKGQLLRLINQLILPPQFQLFGEQRINVLQLNMRLDEIK